MLCLNSKNPLSTISVYLPLLFPFLEGQKDLSRCCWQEWLWLTGNKVTNLLENTLLQDLPRYEDWTTTQVHLYQQDSELFVFIDRWREIPRHLTGSWHVEEGGWFASLFAAKLQQGRVNAVSDNRGFFRARIGIIANQQNDCSTCNSRIGFGTGGDNSCGNEATFNPDNGDKHIRAMGYILVQWQGIRFTFKPWSRYRFEKN